MAGLSRGSPLEIGIVVGGDSPGNTPWVRHAATLQRRSLELGAHLTSPLGINVVFFIPGPLFSPDFSGVRTGTYAKRPNLLLVQAAVDIDSGPPEQELSGLLERAVDAAEGWLRSRRRVNSQLPELRRLVGNL